MQRIPPFLLLLFLPFAVLADGMVIPTIAYPAKITVPDQQALIHFTNGVERLVIQTHFTGSGTNFAWVVPLPSQPVIEKATTGLFPTLQFLFRPQIMHDVPNYYLKIIIAMGLIFLFRFLIRNTSTGFVIFIGFLVVMFLEVMLLPTLSEAGSKGMVLASSDQAVSILDRKLVGIFDTTTISSHDPKALENWLRENGFAVSTNAEPIIASYIKDNWVFVASKIRRDQPDNETSTPQPLSFTFKTDKPVYPMRLTGLNSPSLTVALYVFSDGRVTAPHFKVESCTRPKIVHPLLHQWVGDSAVTTKLTATLSPADMRQDIWLKPSPMFIEKKSCLYSRHGALTTALNWGMGIFIVGLCAIGFWSFASKTQKLKVPRLIGMIALGSMMIAGLVYLALPKIEVKLVRGGFYLYSHDQQFALCFALDQNDFEWHTAAEARVGLQKIISNPTNALPYGLKNWDNYFVGGQVHEEDSPGNYLLRETNNQLELVTFKPDGGEEISGTWDLHAQH